jgi:elongation factor P--(R)-beta-lysine ligase
VSIWKSGASVEVLRKRSTLLQKIRQYFAEKDILEVDTPSISKFPTIDENIDPIEVYLKDLKTASYLITSPEYHMKRLLCFGMPSIYQICKAFRKDEAGNFHNPEFTIIEWYQLGLDDQRLMKSVDDFLQFTLNTKPATFISYKELFEKYLDVNPIELTQSKFLTCCQKTNITPPKELLENKCNTDDQLNFLMGFYIETKIGHDNPVFVYHYPASQSALAKIDPKCDQFSQRFEVFYKGLELGNGYHELQDYQEHLNRFEKIIRKRVESGQKKYNIDRNLMDALESGLPNCAGIAIGFDRLLMIKTGIRNIDEVQSFSSKRC